jgi:hypothetical protein
VLAQRAEAAAAAVVPLERCVVVDRRLPAVTLCREGGGPQPACIAVFEEVNRDYEQADQPQETSPPSLAVGLDTGLTRVKMAFMTVNNHAVGAV